MLPTHYTRIVLAERPKGPINANTFRKEVVPFDLAVHEKDILVKTLYLSLDPTQRTWINDVRGYMVPVQIGEVMRSSGIGVVLQAGKDSRFRVGDVVFGWREYVVLNSHDPSLEKVKVPPGAQVLDYLGPIGMTGLTAYFGLTDIGKIKAGETLVVSGAAGATGSIVCQIGKRIGAKVIAIAGSKEKCDWLERELGVDTAINYKSPTFRKDFIDIVGYLDVYFDNVGGAILDLALARLKRNARIVLCGAIADYNTRPQGIRNYSALIAQRATMQGFLILDYAKRYEDAREILGKWLTEGSLKRQFHVIEGIDKCPEALPLLFSGGNTGKLVVKVSDLPTKAML
ncbi:hypothetical protein NM688_g5404 [Phlebia brevispora]|uniref:Uncharacterized protein n=1 Tax=Phlebia brevispora TaxID=194682 RepID=A0ACC1SW11_9APHY|nr:hypothetical protein NM688_g5404 [Phlebia brevispora]